MGLFYSLKSPVKVSCDKRPLLTQTDIQEFGLGHKRPPKGSGGGSVTGQNSTPEVNH